MLEQVLGLGIDLQLAVVGVLGEVESGDLGDVLVLALTLLLLELEGDTADRALLDTLHQVGGVTGNLVLLSATQNSSLRPFDRVDIYLVAETLGGDDGNLITDPLVGLEVQGELGVVPLNDDLGGLLDSLGTNATHFDGVVTGW